MVSENTMRCLHCHVEFHPDEKLIHLGKDVDGYWAITRFDCPSCKRMNLFLVKGTAPGGIPNGLFTKRSAAAPIRPKGSGRPPSPPEVPTRIAEDYTEACVVLVDSPKASAALSRRCLQHLLRDAAGVTAGNLADEIQQVIDGGSLPSHLVEMVDVVRTIGNFAAHPIKSQRTGQIIPVEAGEAEWNLDVLEALFDFYYVQPAVAAGKRAALNAKLKEAGKKPMK